MPSIPYNAAELLTAGQNSLFLTKMLAGNLKNVLVSSLTDDIATGIHLVIAIRQCSNIFVFLDRINIAC